MINVRKVLSMQTGKAGAGLAHKHYPHAPLKCQFPEGWAQKRNQEVFTE